MMTVIIAGRLLEADRWTRSIIVSLRSSDGTPWAGASAVSMTVPGRMRRASPRQIGRAATRFGHMRIAADAILDRIIHNAHRPQ